ncbi:MAG: P-loop NTPase [candidate division NC10 bacterium]|nr:P-loop NTPase [candidate division NC10 bacterium]
MEKDVLDLLRKVRYPGFSRDIVSFGIVKDIKIEGPRLSLLLDIPTDKVDVAAQIEKKVREALSALPGIHELAFEVRTRAPARVKPARPFPLRQPIEGVEKVLAIASGKGGVGKSTVAVNLALALQRLGVKVGLLDADIYGPSLPTMLGIHERPAVERDSLIPIDQEGLELMSIGFLLDEDAPVIWRGPLVAQLVHRIAEKVIQGLKALETKGEGST